MNITKMPFTENSYIISNTTKQELEEFDIWLRETEICQFSFYEENLGIINFNDKESALQFVLRWS